MRVPIPAFGGFASFSHPSEWVGLEGAGPSQNSAKLSISLQEGHGELTVNGFLLGSDRRGELEMSPPGGLQEFSSPRTTSLLFCFNFPVNPQKLLLSDSKI